MLHYHFIYRDYYRERWHHDFEASSDLDAIKKAEEILKGKIHPDEDILYRYNLESPNIHYRVKFENYGL